MSQETATTGASEASQFSDPKLIERLHELRRTDNRTNWIYILRAWVYLGIVIGGATWFFMAHGDLGLAWWWNVPVALVAIALIGAGQHQLVGLVHEGAHYTLFRSKLLNELASDLLCMFPVISTTYFYRLQHLAHHQFVNDEERDPDLLQLKESGHWLDFPVEKKALLRKFLLWLWPSKLILYSAARGRRAASGGGKNPYRETTRRYSKKPKYIAITSLLLMIGAVTVFVSLGDKLWLFASAGAIWLGSMVLNARLRPEEFETSRLRPALPHKPMAMLRLTYVQAIVVALGWTTLQTGRWAGVYFIVLWLVPLFTSFSFFMMLRQLVQHGNNDSGRVTNTHTFLVNPIARWAVFPIGQDYHLPHHLFASVPHYRLKDLHATLMELPHYSGEEVEVEGYLFPQRPPPRPPTVVEALGPGHSRTAHEAWIDETVLEEVGLEDSTPPG